MQPLSIALSRLPHTSCGKCSVVPLIGFIESFTSISVPSKWTYNRLLGQMRRTPDAELAPYFVRDNGRCSQPAYGEWEQSLRLSFESFGPAVNPDETGPVDTGTPRARFLTLISLIIHYS